MKKYESYKESGYDWFGLIPDSWQVRPLKYLFSICSGSTPDTNNLEFWDGGIKWITPADYKTDDKFVSGGRKTITERGLKSCSSIVLPIGSIVFSKRAPIGSLAITSEELCTNQGCLGCIPNGVNSEYYYYCMSILKEAFELYGSGTTFKEISASDFSNFKIVVPSLDEQEAIANYLDYKTSQIDAAISAIDSQIEDLKAYRQSVIREKVTKGLVSGRIMKDSGIRWIGEMPEDWEALLLKRVAKILTGSTPSTSENKYWDNPDYTWYTPSDIADESICLKDSERKVNSSAVTDGVIKEFPKDSLLMVGIGSIGKIGIAEKPCSANQQINAIVFNESVNARYGAYFIFASRENIRSKANAALLPIINQTTMGNIEFLLPSIEEQQSIVNYLDSVTLKIEQSIKLLESQNSDLCALKQSIISEAVTGKVDVRDWTPINE